MTKFLAALVMMFAFSLSAQSFYYNGLKTESFSTPAAALSFVQNNLDMRQQLHVTVVPVRVIDNPPSSNPPDVMTWVVLWQPSSNNGTDGMIDVSASGQPAQLWFNGPCGGGVGAPYLANSFPTASSALALFNNLDPHVAPFAAIVGMPDLGGDKYAVIQPAGSSGFCR